MKLFISTLLVISAASALQAQVVSLGSSTVGTVAQDTTPRPPQVVKTFPSSVSDDVLLGTDSLKTSVNDIDISFGVGSPASAKTPMENAELDALRNEVQVLREEIQALREEVKELRAKKGHGKWPFRHKD